jgi:hypothetical protein
MEEMVTTATSEITAVPDEPDRVPRGRARAVMLAVTGLMIAATFVLGAVGSQARSKASEDRAHERAATHSRRTLEHQRLVADRDGAEVESALRAMPEKFGALGVAMDDNAAAQEHFSDVVNHGADLYNAGDLDGAKALYQGEATAALADVAHRTAEVQQAWQDVQAALGALEEVQ